MSELKREVLLDTLEAAFRHVLRDIHYKDTRARYEQAREQIKALIQKPGIDKYWLPTPENINVLPEPVRKYIYDLETNADPAHIVRENILIKDTCRALVIKLEEKGKVDQAFVNTWAKKITPDFFKEEAVRLGSVSLVAGLLKYMLKEAGVKVVKK